MPNNLIIIINIIINLNKLCNFLIIPNTGSSAGVGSGDFHIYRGIRRREYERQKFVLEKAAKEEMDNEFLYAMLFCFLL